MGQTKKEFEKIQRRNKTDEIPEHLKQNPLTPEECYPIIQRHYVPPVVNGEPNPEAPHPAEDGWEPVRN